MLATSLEKSCSPFFCLDTGPSFVLHSKNIQRTVAPFVVATIVTRIALVNSVHQAVKEIINSLPDLTSGNGHTVCITTNVKAQRLETYVTSSEDGFLSLALHMIESRLLLNM